VDILDLIGMNKDIAEEQAINSGILNIRVVSTDALVTMDWNPKRLTIIHDNSDIVVDVKMG